MKKEDFQKYRRKEIHLLERTVANRMASKNGVQTHRDRAGEDSIGDLSGVPHKLEGRNRPGRVEQEMEVRLAIVWLPPLAVQK